MIITVNSFVKQYTQSEITVSLCINITEAVVMCIRLIYLALSREACCDTVLKGFRSLNYVT